MKIAHESKTLKTGMEMEEEDFDIGNQAMVMKILRSMIYSNPIRAIVQEVMSNARDAHREHGNPERAILVKLPNKMDEEFWIRDFGVGISPERMSNVFIKYGESTKRGDNQQTGGFGLGAKSPWAYADNFQIETYYPDDEGQMLRRRYMAVIDESDRGKLLRVGPPEHTEEERGTKIMVQVRDGDGPKFAQWVEDRARYWDPRPEVIGDPDFTWAHVTSLFNGDNWRIVNNGGNIALVDGVPYPVERASILMPAENVHGGEAPCKLAFDMGFIIEVGVGEVTVAAHREGIDYSDDTIAVIRQRLETMMGEVATKVSEAITNAADLWEANRIFMGLPEMPKRIVKGTANWNGHPVAGNFSMPSVGFKTVVYERSHKRHDQGVGTKSSMSAYFNFPDKEERVYLMDEENLQRGRALYLFRTHDRNEIEKVRILVVPTGDTPERKKQIKEAYDKAEKEHGLRTLIESLDGFSTVEKWNYRKHGPKISRGNGGPRHYGGPVIRVKEIVHSEWKESAVTLDEDEVVFVQLYGGKPFMAKDKERRTEIGVIRNLQVGLDIQVVGVQTPFINKVPEGWIWLQDAVEEKFQEVISNPDYAAAMTLDRVEHRIDNNLSDIDTWIDEGKLDVNENGLLDQWRKESARQVELIELQGQVLYWSNLTGRGHGDADEALVKHGTRLKAIEKAALEAMPLLPMIENSTHGSEKRLMEEVQWYISERDPERNVNGPEAELDKKAHDLYKGNGGAMTYAQIEDHLSLKRHNGNAGRRAVMRHQKRMGLATV